MFVFVVSIIMPPFQGLSSHKTIADGYVLVLLTFEFLLFTSAADPFNIPYLKALQVIVVFGFYQ